MKKLIACLPVLSLLIMSCTTFSPIGRDRGFSFPEPKNGAERETWKKTGSHVDGELISIDQNTLLPPPTGPEPVVYIDIRDASKLWAFIMIYRMLRDLIEIVFLIPSIYW